MTNSWRMGAEDNFGLAWGHTQKRIMRQERRPTINNATQILGPGAGPFAVLLNDWNEQAGTFNGIFYSEPGAINAPDTQGSPVGTPSTMWWMGETFGVLDIDGYLHGYQRLTRFHVADDIPGAPPSAWEEHRRRFFPQGELIAYTAWEAV